MADQVESPADLATERQHVRGELFVPVGVDLCRARTGAVSTLIRRQALIAGIRQRRHQVRPHEGRFGRAVEQQDWLS
ncbi:MAG TPA: hypothetical protein VIB47_01395, partial [Dehalococcoidia bacterium]